VQQSIPGKSTVIPNFYNPVFDQFTHAVKDKHTVFVGRLVSDKGVDLLIRSFKQVIATFPDAQLTIFGDGPEKGALLEIIDSLLLTKYITINTPLPPEALAQQLAHYKWLVIPSIWEEPFGLVALEGLASGCKIIAANGGGLPEAVGNFGLLFKRGNQQDLTNTLIKAYSESTLILNNNQALQTHLTLHSRSVIAKNYIQAFSKLIYS
ncbi:MAG: group 1 glycosyl, partial [Chitinophagaceae bacterium]